ncbi:hypothetical protein [Streptomyces sp. NPDC005017]|uniref:hypothetical protein n=1 Tax=Streptomyces sp. NPDC005017 TaxID=3364706 RepID=UPI0036B99C14
MNGSSDSGTAETSDQPGDISPQAQDTTEGTESAEGTDGTDGTGGPDEPGDPVAAARRARWTAAATGGLLALAGAAAALLRLTGSAPLLVPAAYAVGSAVCATAALLGSRGRTRRALWLLIAGVTVMAFGDQFD